MSPYVVFSLPRSRSYWLSRFLSYRDWECGHEQLRYMRTLDDVKSWLLLPNTGTCETAGAPFWRLLLKYEPNIRVVTVRRPPEEVVESLCRAGLQTNVSAIRQAIVSLDRKLDQIEGRMPNVRRFEYRDLADEIPCAELFEYCLPYGHDSDRWHAIDDVNLQINLGALLTYAAVHLPALKKLAAQAKQVTLKDMALQAPDMQGAVIAEETFEDWVRDCQHLFRQHCVEIGEHPDNWMNKNIPLMRKLYDIGIMQVMIGRSNGKAFGYLMTIIAPSLEAENRQSSQHTTFYADSSLPGLGLKLQRAALAALSKKGVHETFMRTGVRGDGDRLDTIYRRLGGQEFGRMYRVELGT